MRSFQAVLAFFVAAMVNMAFAAAGIHAAATILAFNLVDTVLCSAFQHTVVAPGPGRDSFRKVGCYPWVKANHTAGCFDNSTSTPTGRDNSTLVPWTALANGNDTVATLCREISATILTRDLPYTRCEPDKCTNGTYGIIAQVTYSGPQDVIDMRGNYELCIGAFGLLNQCTYGGLFEEFEEGGSWKLSPNYTQLWNVQARPILGRCPDCAGGLVA